MAENFRDLLAGFSAEERALIDKEAQLLFLEYKVIAQLRKDQDLTQKELATILDIRQNAISRIENQEDILVSTLEKYVQALGGELEIRAKFPDRVVALQQFTGSFQNAHN